MKTLNPKRSRVEGLRYYILAKHCPEAAHDAAGKGLKHLDTRGVAASDIISS